MIVWGISANSHDAALSVFRDNELIFASHSERFSGIKNDPDLCGSLVEYARQWGEPERVYWYENPYLKTARQLFAGQGWKFSENNISKYLKRWNIHAPISYTSHHLSHAAAGYFTSTYSDACVIVLDAIGEYNTLTIWQGKGDKLTRLFKLDFPDSIGLWYSAMTQRCGLKPLEDEYILMGMAAYGDPDRLVNDILNDFFWFDEYFTEWESMGVMLASRRNLHQGCLDWRPELTSTQDLYDIAAGTQAAYEYILERILSYAVTMSKSKNLVLMGGCALNCSANRILGKYYDNIWIMPNPGDAGSSLGSVLAHTKKRLAFSTAYIGYDMGKNEKDENIVDHILEHKICGLARNKAEFGPRALGNRSLLADPRGNEIKDRVNEIKHRQKFRPFAPAILEELAHDYFIFPSGWDNSRYMQVVAKCRYPELFPAIVHADGSSRVQTVAKGSGPFRELLEKWYERTGCPMLLNTSLNIKGQPMVNDHKDAEAFEKKYGVKVFN